MYHITVRMRAIAFVLIWYLGRLSIAQFPRDLGWISNKTMPRDTTWLLLYVLTSAFVQHQNPVGLNVWIGNYIRYLYAEVTVTTYQCLNSMPYLSWLISLSFSRVIGVICVPYKNSDHGHCLSHKMTPQASFGVLLTEFIWDLGLNKQFSVTCKYSLAWHGWVITSHFNLWVWLLIRNKTLPLRPSSFTITPLL